jgi:hypothetical protein
LVIPGDYTVKLTVNAKTLAQKVHVEQDPRSPIEQKILEDQRDLALRIIGEMNRAADLETKALEAKSLESRAMEAKAPNESRAQIGKALMGLGSALSAVVSADRSPPAQAVEVFEESKAALDKLSR